MNKIQKVLLVVPPGTSYVQLDGAKQCKECFPPLGLAYLASELKASGQYDVRVYDIVVEDFWKETFISSDTVLYGSSFKQYQKLLEEYRPDLVGIQCMLSSRSNSVLELCRITKELNDEIFTVLGGHHAAALPEHVLQKHTDFVVLGEADHSFPELVNRLNNGGDISKLNGIAYRQNGRVIVQERRDFVKDLNSLPLPAWDIVGLEKYWLGVISMGGPPKKKRYAVMNASRGCPHNCCYCAVPHHTRERNYRERDLDKVINEIKWLINRYGIEEVQFTDDNFFVNRHRIKKLCRLLISNFPGIHFSVPTGADLPNLDFELIDLLKEAGFHDLMLGIETGDIDTQRRFVDKKIDLSRLKEKINYIKHADLEPYGLFMIGFPDETPEQIQRTVDLATSLDLDRILLIMVTPLPGSRLYKHCVENNLLYDDFDVAKLRYSNTFIKNRHISREQLEGIRRDAWREYMSERINIEEYDNRGWSQDPGKKAKKV